jgi:hypothetical protein
MRPTKQVVWVSENGYGDKSLENVIWRDLKARMEERSLWKESTLSFIFDNMEEIHDLIGQILENRDSIKTSKPERPV